MLKVKNFPFAIGQNIWIRTFTMYNYGRVEAVFDDCVFLDKSSWIAHVVCFAKFAQTGVSQDSRPMDNGCFMSLNAMVDMGIYYGGLTGKESGIERPLVPWRHGSEVWIRTGSVYNIGRILTNDDSFVYLDKSAWVANTKAWSEWTQGKPQKGSEIHPLKEEDILPISKNAIVDWGYWRNPNTIDDEMKKHFVQI